MAWKVRNVMDARIELVSRYLAGERMTDLCREFEVSRKTAYKFVSRYRDIGSDGLHDQSKAPRRVPHTLAPEVVEAILGLKAEFPTWGAKKIRAELPRRYPGVRVPAQSTIHRHLALHGLVRKKRRRNVAPRYSKKLTRSDQPNDVWCADFKGQFRLGSGSYCYPLTVSDFATRYLLRCSGLKTVRGEETRPVWEALFAEHGLPRVIRTDNGAPFATTGIAALSRLSVWWLKLGIRHERIAPGHPEQNGRHERMHLTLKQEATRPASSTLIQQQDRFEQFMDTYNHRRPHEALDMKRPGDLYAPSTRPYRPVPAVSYPFHDDVRKVRSDGTIRFHQVRYFLGRSLSGELVGLRQLNETRWLVSFCSLDLGELDRSTNKLHRNPDPYA